LFTIADDSNPSSNSTSQESLEELDPLANHHVTVTHNVLLNKNYNNRPDPNYRPEYFQLNYPTAETSF